LAQVIDGIRDRLQGIETRALPPDARTDLAHGHPYAPSDWDVLHTLLPASAVVASDVFLDVGCGKGRVLLEAIRYPFARIEGVEVSAPLAAIAEANVQRILGPDSPRVRVRVGDACALDLPDDVTVLYLFNPFHDERFERFLDRVEESLARTPRTMRVLYLQPTMDGRLRARGFVSELVMRDRVRYRRPIVFTTARMPSVSSTSDAGGTGSKMG
jgi:SAM-dependent methyltransferase